MKHVLWVVLLLGLLPGCEGLATDVSATPVESTPTEEATLPPTEALEPTPAGPLTLRLWLPPELDPNSGTTAGRILQTRLNEFAARRPEARLEVRIKGVDGPGGLIDSLTNASAAAPMSLPDLVALPRPQLEAAALKGLLRPFDGLIKPLDDADWYEYALQMARLQNSTFGLPFAGDALTLVYRPSMIPQPPQTFSETLSVPGPLIFPAADRQALFTLTQYQANGGKILDEQGRPTLQAVPLSQVLEHYQKGISNDHTPAWLTQYQDDEQAWQGFSTNNAPMVITWFSRYLNTMPADTSAAPPPTLDGKPYTLGTGWVWAMASPNPEHEKLSAELAEFLSEGEFLSQWTSALGYLPPRLSALQNWRDANQRSLANQIVATVQMLPSEDVLTSLSLPLEQATMQVFKQENNPAGAAEQAVEKLTVP